MLTKKSMEKMDKYGIEQCRQGIHQETSSLN